MGLIPNGTTCRCVLLVGEQQQLEAEEVVATVRILQHRLSRSFNDDNNNQDEYYVHIEGNDPRLDEWVSASRLKVVPAADPVAAAASPPASLARSHSSSSSSSSSSSHKRIKRQGDSDETLPLSLPDNNKRSSSSSSGQHRHGHGHAGAHVAKVRNVDRVLIGQHLIDCWYYSPYALQGETSDTLYICQHTFQYMQSPRVFARHRAKQSLVQEQSLTEADRAAGRTLRPPGPLIYHEPGYLSVYRVEGSTQRLYCQNLCLLGKLFLDHKTLYFDPSHFYFFVLVDHPGNQFVGYFSKEKDSTEDFNLACILTLPPFQRLGYGKFIISLSYELSKREGKQQTPEKPLSDLGKLSYRAYWSCILLRVLLDACQSGARPSVADISKQTGIKLEDTVSTLQHLGCVKFFKRCFVLAVSQAQIETLWRPFEQKNFSSTFCKPQCFVEEEEEEQA